MSEFQTVRVNKAHTALSGVFELHNGRLYMPHVCLKLDLFQNVCVQEVKQ